MEWSIIHFCKFWKIYNNNIIICARCWDFKGNTEERKFETVVRCFCIPWNFDKYSFPAVPTSGIKYIPFSSLNSCYWLLNSSLFLEMSFITLLLRQNDYIEVLWSQFNSIYCYNEILFNCAPLEVATKKIKVVSLEKNN